MLKNRLFGIGKFSVNVKELITAMVVVVLGIIFTTQKYLVFINGLTPPVGYFLNLFIFYVIIYVFSWLGLSFITFKLGSWSRFVGLFLITLALLIVTTLNSPYINVAVTGHEAEGISSIYFQSADGSVWFLWDKIFDSVRILWFLTYVFTPFVLIILGAMTINEDVKL